MNSVSNSMEMAASPDEVFLVISNLVAWPKYLPHYRWIRVMESHPDYQMVRMACYRGWIPIDWVSRFSVDHVSNEIHFQHLKGITQGMKVRWKLEPVKNGTSTRVTLVHDMEPVQKRFGTFLSKKVIGDFFIHFVATQTLKNFAKHFQSSMESKKVDSVMVLK